jgi:hypothetical protein
MNRSEGTSPGLQALQVDSCIRRAVDQKPRTGSQNTLEAVRMKYSMPFIGLRLRRCLRIAVPDAETPPGLRPHLRSAEALQIDAAGE